MHDVLRFAGDKVDGFAFVDAELAIESFDRRALNPETKQFKSVSETLNIGHIAFYEFHASLSSLPLPRPRQVDCIGIERGLNGRTNHPLKARSYSIHQPLYQSAPPSAILPVLQKQLATYYRFSKHRHRIMMTDANNAP